MKQAVAFGDVNVRDSAGHSASRIKSIVHQHNSAPVKEIAPLISKGAEAAPQIDTFGKSDTKLCKKGTEDQEMAGAPKVKTLKFALQKQMEQNLTLSVPDFVAQYQRNVCHNQVHQEMLRRDLDALSVTAQREKVTIKPKPLKPLPLAMSAAQRLAKKVEDLTIRRKLTHAAQVYKEGRAIEKEMQMLENNEKYAKVLQIEEAPAPIDSNAGNESKKTRQTQKKPMAKRLKKH